MWLPVSEASWLAGSIAFPSVTKQTIRAPSVWQSKANLMGSRKQREERDEDPVFPSEACPSIASCQVPPSKDSVISQSIAPSAGG